MQSTRREILTALLGLPVGLACAKRTALTDFDGGFVGDLAEDGHRVRDGFLPEATATEEIPILILGAGIAGLAAGRRLLQRGLDRFRIFEMASEPGGTALGGRSEVTAHPWGAHYLPVPSASNTDLLELLREIGCLQDNLQFRETDLVVAPKERVFYRGEWHKGLHPPCSGSELAEYRRFEALADRWAATTGADGRRAFALPLSECSRDPELLSLDRISLADYLAKQGFRSPLLRWYVDYACRDDFGLDSTETSAWYGLHYFAARIPSPEEESAEFLTWPEGNAFLVKHLVDRIGPRIETNTLVLRISPEGDGRRGRVRLFDRTRRTAKDVVTERIIFALPSFLRPRIISGYPGSDYRPRYAPWLVANVHLAARPGWVGFEPAWDNVIYGSRSLGYVVATHQAGPDHGPTVWTYYLPLARADELLSLSWRDAADAIAAELDRTHEDFRKHVRRIDVMRWGHGMVQPRPGVRQDPLRERAQEALGPIHFAHSDLSGVALFEEAFFHGQRAAGEVARAMGV